MEETQARTEQHKGGKHKLHIPVHLLAQNAHHPVMHGRNQVRPHLKDEDRQGEDCGNQQRTAQRSCFVLTTFTVLIASIRRIRGQRSRRIPRLFDRCLKVGHRQGAGKVTYLRAFCGQIDSGLEHARNLFECLLYPAYARGAGHALDRQLKGLLWDAVTRTFDGVYRCLRIGHAGKGQIGTFGGQIDRSRMHARYGIECALDTTYARSTGHAFDRQAQAAGGGLG
ncbi:hypothetical protein D3C79_540720 [compost metagenome]